MRNRPAVALVLSVLVAVALLAFGYTGLFEPLTGNPTPGAASSVAPAPPGAGPGSAGAVVENPSGLPAVRESELPADARKTLALIRAGGPYRYSQDNQTFGNLERILPLKDRGYYREYTVPTPGESDRGARRIVTGDGGEKYYTADHYDSFSFIAEGS
ncbi:MAG TPA: ribonuclease domain-containing protein [Arthrobacter sp.]